jgi:hypothetical protein
VNYHPGAPRVPAAMRYDEMDPSIANVAETVGGRCRHSSKDSPRSVRQGFHLDGLPICQGTRMRHHHSACRTLPPSALDQPPQLALADNSHCLADSDDRSFEVHARTVHEIT